MTTAYLESSALVKLVVDETETSPLRNALRLEEVAISSELATLEVGRAVARRLGAQGLARARTAFLGLELTPVDRPILEVAARLGPFSLRSLDAIHVATALALESSDLVFYSFDRRTIEAAEANGLTVASPGA